MNFDSLRFYICKTPLDLKMSDVNTSGNWRAEAAGETQLRTFNVPHNQEVKQEAVAVYEQFSLESSSVPRGARCAHSATL